jgi:hypothetical protein
MRAPPMEMTDEIGSAILEAAIAAESEALLRRYPLEGCTTWLQGERRVWTVAHIVETVELRSLEIEHRVESIETRICNAHPEIVALLIKPQTRQRFEQWKTMRYGRPEI